MWLIFALLVGVGACACVVWIGLVILFVGYCFRFFMFDLPLLIVVVGLLLAESGVAWFMSLFCGWIVVLF